MEKSFTQTLSGDRSATIGFLSVVIGGLLFVAISGFLLVAIALSPASAATGATLYLSPSTGAFNVGETFTVSVYVNTGGEFVNAVQADLAFPPDKLQVVSPSVGKSFIEIWVAQPEFSNINGTISFKGALPSPGINVSQGLISTITFRVKSTGRAVLRFSDDSKVLLNDGKGTNVLVDTTNGIYDLVLPPPAGPIITSSTHPDQGKWYSNNSVIFKWSGDSEIEAYSYILNREPVTVPDDISEGVKESVSYTNVSDGANYFHLKALRGKVWGGVSHFVVNVDAVPPAAFEIMVEPGSRTTNIRPIIYFNTTDSHSGLSHYELKVIALSAPNLAQAGLGGDQNFFVEATSPHVPELERGKSEIIVRAYDDAGNFREVSKRIVVGSLPAVLAGWLGQGWFWVFLILIFFLGVSFLYYYHWRQLHRHVSVRKNAGVLSQAQISQKIKELQELQKRYQKAGVALMVLIIFGFSLLASFVPKASLAQAEPEKIPAPLVTTYQETATNDELFYVGGKHNIPESKIIIFVQNEDSGERFQFETRVDRRGDWFYAHDSFLSPGSYQLWAQARLDEVESPPSAQENFRVSSAVLRLGASKISFETIYFIAALILFLTVIIISASGFLHHRELRRKHTSLVKEIEEAEESIRRGFALIKRDIEDELRLFHNIKISRQLAAEESAKEKLLLEDLARVEVEIGKEVWDIKLQS